MNSKDNKNPLDRINSFKKTSNDSKPEANPGFRRASKIKEDSYSKENSCKSLPYNSINRVINTFKSSNNSSSNKSNKVNNSAEINNVNINNQLDKLAIKLKEDNNYLFDSKNLKKEKAIEILEEKIPSEEALPAENLPSVSVPYIKEVTYPLRKKYCLVLDLDETLIHYKTDKYNPDDGEMLVRPYMYEFLDKLGLFYELVLFTAGTEEYGTALSEGIEENKKYFQFKFFRQHTLVEGEDFIKDLSRIGRPLDKTIIVDNMAVNYRNHKENGILIKPYYGSYKNDMALYYLGDILLKIAEDNSISDIRKGLIKYKEDIIRTVTSARGWKK